FSSPSKHLNERFDNSSNSLAESSPSHSQESFYPSSQNSSPSSRLRERLGRRLHDSRPVIDRAGSLYLNQASSPITGIFIGQPGADTNTCTSDHEKDKETEADDIDVSTFRLTECSNEPIPGLPFVDLPRRISDLEERVRYWERVVNGLEEESALGPGDPKHAQKLMKSYKKKLEETRSLLHLV